MRSTELNKVIEKGGNIKGMETDTGERTEAYTL